MAQFIIYSPKVNGWLAADDYWAVISHPWTYQGVPDMLEQRQAYLEIGQLRVAYFVWTRKKFVQFFEF